MDITAIIANTPMFQGLPPEQYKELASIGVTKEFGRGRVIFSEGEVAGGFYVVLTGKVKVYKVSPEGKEQILHILGPGEPFAEVPVFEGKNFPANATAIESSRLCFFPRSAFVDLINKHPSLALNMLAVLSRRLRTFASLIDNLSLKEVPARLAAQLLFLSEKQGGTSDLELDVPKNQLAGMLGTIPETLSRILAKMIQQEIIQSDGPRIKILQRNTLEELAQGLRRLT